MSSINKSRRKFITNSAKGTIALTVGLSSAGSFITSCAHGKNITAAIATVGFDQQPLPYKYDALENVIDAMTMEIHYSKHAAAYVKNMNEAIAELGLNKMDREVALTVERLLSEISKYNPKLRNNTGGHYNHEMFWQCMRPKAEGNKPMGNLQLAINKEFNSFDDFKKQFADAGKTRFGSGWAWLYADANKNLKIGSTPNQDNPLMDISDIKGTPLLALDVWEHAYYLKYQNKRADYIENWWQVVNWDYVEGRFEKI
jgi:superoxide dismutase, Fe-Mn family